MGKYPQNRFRRLVLVGPSGNKRQPFSSAPRWWGKPPLNHEKPATRPTREQFKALRMAVMPTLSRGMWLEAMSSVVKFVRSYFVAPRRQRTAVVLAFRRPWEKDAFVTKKASSSVCWSNDQASQEGGRG
ncbi:MAG TPA: hypothetical protein VMB49_10570 [Acidobacteriaceae bacterium]|nr:hypothetical protein [Acidobacteriaceae bacterium]